MIKFDVLNRFSGAVQFTAEIDCEEGKSRSVKLGLAVKWALKTKANLYGANLDGANLNGANLNRASFYRANLDGASFYRANLDGANLNGANLNGASFYRANLDGANLDGANLNGASFYGANLNRASFYRANLDGANLDGANGINDYVKCIQVEQYPICYTSNVMQIGCQRHPIKEWREFEDKRIAEMDGKDALKFWRKHKDWIFQTIELCPAMSTNPDQTVPAGESK